MAASLLLGGRRRRTGAICQTLVDGRRPVSWQHLRHIDLMTTLHLPDLLSAALFRSLAILGSHGIRIDQLLREGRFGEHAHGYQT